MLILQPTPWLSPINYAPLTLDLEDGLGEVSDVLASDTRDGDTSILGQVNGVVLGDLLYLLGLEAGVSEHADLVGDVRPVVLGTERLELPTEQLAHGDDAVGHALDFALPLLVQLGVVQDSGSNTGAVDGGVGVHGADDDLDLRVEALDLLGVLADNREDTSTLTVETLGSTMSANWETWAPHSCSID